MKDMRTFYKVGSVLGGVIWLLAAICFLFDSLAVDILSVLLFLIGTVIAAIRLRWTGTLQSDEMSDLHLIKSKAYALDIIYILMFAIAVLELFKTVTGLSIQIDAHTFSLFVLGAAELVLGLKFLYLEKNGDE